MAAVIKLSGVSKRFQYHWIFQNIDFEFNSGQPTAVVGPNGSGKSTLVQIVAGLVTPTEGKLTYTINDRPVPVDEIFTQISIVAPALEVIEEMNLGEMLNFHFKFKGILDGVTKDDIIDLLGFTKDKEIRNYSSGMKQRVKLVLGIFSKSNILLLDEPTNNLDEAGQNWYQDLIQKYTQNRVVIVSSNEPREYTFCKTLLNLGDYR